MQAKHTKPTATLGLTYHILFSFAVYAAVIVYLKLSVGPKSLCAYDYGCNNAELFQDTIGERTPTTGRDIDTLNAFIGTNYLTQILILMGSAGLWLVLANWLNKARSFREVMDKPLAKESGLLMPAYRASAAIIIVLTGLALNAYQLITSYYSLLDEQVLNGAANKMLGRLCSFSEESDCDPNERPTFTLADKLLLPFCNYLPTFVFATFVAYRAFEYASNKWTGPATWFPQEDTSRSSRSRSSGGEKSSGGRRRRRRDIKPRNPIYGPNGETTSSIQIVQVPEGSGAKATSGTKRLLEVLSQSTGIEAAHPGPSSSG